LKFYQNTLEGVIYYERNIGLDLYDKIILMLKKFKVVG
jgi:hypothetical protein